MLTPRQNLLETIRGGNPDRFVNQYEFLDAMFVDPINMTIPIPAYPGAPTAKDFWGITWCWPEHTPGLFPVHDEEHIVLKDIENWRDYVHAPSLDFPEELWEASRQEYAKVDREKYFAGPMITPGLFEMLHSLMGMEEALMAFYTNPDEVKEIIDYIVDWECGYAKLLGEKLHPDILFHHDDWGSNISTFLSPEMFAEFFLEPYKRLYQCYRDNGVQVIIHHSDSYAATLVPYMIEMGIDIWQGAVLNNDLPKLIDQYGGKISFMAGIDSSEVDRVDWTKELIAEKVRWACEKCGSKFFIPCCTAGGSMSTYEGVYDTVSEEIAKQKIH